MQKCYFCRTLAAGACLFFAAECLINLVKNKKMSKKRPAVSLPFLVLAVLFTVCLVAANLLETKQVAFCGMNLTAGLIVFPVSYIIGDCLTEVYGFRPARLVIWLGFLMNAFFVVAGLAADMLPPAPYWHGQQAFHEMFGLAPRIVAGSFVAFLSGSLLNAYVMSRMKRVAGEKGFSLRAILSTVAGECVDSLVFFPIALGGVIPWTVLPGVMLAQVVLKTIYEILALPLTIRVVKMLKRAEGGEAVDEHISYNPFRIFDLQISGRNDERQ